MRYLSDDWIDAANQRVQELSPVSTELVVRYQVTAGPDGDRQYHVVFGPGDMAIVADHPRTDVTLSLAWEDATAIATGSLSAKRAFLDGRMSLSGDAATLIGHQEAFKDVMDVLAELREQTEFV